MVEMVVMVVMDELECFFVFYRIYQGYMGRTLDAAVLSSECARPAKLTKTYVRNLSQHYKTTAKLLTMLLTDVTTGIR